MEFQRRRCQIQAGTLDTFLAAWTTGFYPLREAFGFTVVGAWAHPDRRVSAEGATRQLWNCGDGCVVPARASGSVFRFLGLGPGRLARQKVRPAGLRQRR